MLELAQQQPQLFAANARFARNEGATMSEVRTWRRAKRVIPRGNISKRAEMFLPEQWPAYFSRAKGCRSIQGRKLIDMSIMGIGTNLLGYSHLR